MASVSVAQQSANSVSGTFTASGDSASVRSHGSLFLHLEGTFSATITVKFSPDNGQTWYQMQKDGSGNAISFTQPVSVPLYPNHNGSLWKLSCAFTSGTVTYVLAGG
jgi:hypothetical protein